MVLEREGEEEKGERIIDGETWQQAARARNGETTTSSTANRKQKET